MSETAIDLSSSPARAPHVIAIASGKGGVGKTNLTANRAVAAAGRGVRVGVLDADLGLADPGVLYGLSPERSLRDVVCGECGVPDVVVEGPGGVRVIPAASGFDELTRLGADERLRLLAEMDGLEDSVDVLLVDTAAGISANVLYFTAAAADALIVITPEPTSPTGAYALVNAPRTRYGRREFLVAVNMAAGAADAEAAFQRLARVAERFLRVRLEYQGYVPYDDALPRAVRHQRPVVLAAPGSPASQGLAALAGRLALRSPGRPTGGVQFFFRRLVGEGRAS